MDYLNDPALTGDDPDDAVEPDEAPEGTKPPEALKGSEIAEDEILNLQEAT